MADSTLPTVLDVHAAAIAAGLADSRNTLLSGIRADFVASLPSAPTPAAQLLSDLHALADVEKLVDGTVPLAIWLLNAIALVGPRQEAESLRRALWYLTDATADVLAVATRLQANKPSWARQSRDRRDRLAIYFESIARCLEDLTHPTIDSMPRLRRCGELEVYAMHFSDAVGDALPAAEIGVLAKTLAQATAARRLAHELERDRKRKNERSRALERMAEASGLFRGLAATVRV